MLLIEKLMIVYPLTTVRNGGLGQNNPRVERVDEETGKKEERYQGQERRRGWIWGGN